MGKEPKQSNNKAFTGERAMNAFRSIGQHAVMDAMEKSAPQPEPQPAPASATPVPPTKEQSATLDASAPSATAAPATRVINVAVSQDIYRRMNTMKLASSERTTLKAMALQAIEAFLNANGF